jgi:hypothetical protein
MKKVNSGLGTIGHSLDGFAKGLKSSSAKQFASKKEAWGKKLDFLK